MLLLLMILVVLGVGTLSDDAEIGDPTSTAAARAGVKLAVGAVEVCAASRSDARYFGPSEDDPTPVDCLDPETLCQIERELCTVEIGSTPPAAGGLQVAQIGRAGMAYYVQSAIEIDGGGTGYFAELHQSDGSLHKLCGDEPFGPAALPDGTELLAECDEGTWK